MAIDFNKKISREERDEDSRLVDNIYALNEFVFSKGRFPEKSDGSIYDKTIELKKTCMSEKDLPYNSGYEIRNTMGVFFLSWSYEDTALSFSKYIKNIINCLGGVDSVKGSEDNKVLLKESMYFFCIKKGYCNQDKFQGGYKIPYRIWLLISAMYPDFYDEDIKGYFDLISWALCNSCTDVCELLLKEKNTFYNSHMGSVCYNLAGLKGIVDRYLQSGRLTKEEVDCIVLSFNLNGSGDLLQKDILLKTGLTNRKYRDAMASVRDKMRGTFGLTSAVTFRKIDGVFVSKLNYDLRNGKVPDGMKLSQSNIQYRYEIEKLNLPVRVFNAMVERNIVSIRDFLRYCSKKGNLEIIHGIGEKSIAETEVVLRKLGYVYDNVSGVLMKI